MVRGGDRKQRDRRLLKGHLRRAVDSEQPKQFAANLVPHDAGKTTTAQSPAATGVASTRSGGLVACQDTPQCGNGPRVVTSSLQLGERVPHRTHQLSGLSWSASQATVWSDRYGIVSAARPVRVSPAACTCCGRRSGDPAPRLSSEGAGVVVSFTVVTVWPPASQPQRCCVMLLNSGRGLR
jgi:hypothetical protein